MAAVLNDDNLYTLTRKPAYAEKFAIRSGSLVEFIAREADNSVIGRL